MKKLATCFLILMTPLFAENLFENATMDTAGGWKGTKKIADENEGVAKEVVKPDKEHKGNRVLILTAKKSDSVTFSQEITTKNVTDLTLKFRYRTKDYAGRGMEIRGKRQDGGSTYRDYKLVADGEWHEVTWDFSQVQGSKKTDFEFTLLQGEGAVAFDDISAESK